MQPATIALSPGLSTHFTSPDGLIDVDVPPAAVTAADVASAGGGISLLLRQALPPSGSNAGASGHYSFGTYLAQVVDANGQMVNQGLRAPLSIRLHPGRRGSALDLAHALLLVNHPLPSWFDLNPVSSAQAPTVTTGAASASTSPAPPSAGTSPSPAKLGPTASRRAALDTSTNTLSASVPMASPSTSFSFDTDAPVASFGKPDPFDVSLNAGALTARYPIDVPAAPGGLTPPLALAYDSAAVSEQHNPQAAAPWVGEGWNLSLGEISWAEHNVRSGCPSCGVQWEDSWELNDPFGTQAELAPPNIDVTTYYDDTPNNITPSPLTWHTAPETHAKVISFVGPNSLPGMTAVPPCFRVFLPTGVMEEFGCTPDSLQFYPDPGGPNAGLDYVANWRLDLITDPKGNQVHVTYQTDTESGFNSISYPRDAELATVEYDSPGCHNAQTACTGGAWAPLMRVNFAASHTVAHVSGSSCAANGNLRCDDPVDLSGSGGLAAPTVQSTFVLNDIQAQARSSGSASWSTLRDYQLSYDQAGPTTFTDPISGVPESAAGKLTLTQLKFIGGDGSTSLPVRSFGYAQITSYYEDSLQPPSPSTNCGPSWNTGTGTGCILWSQSYGGSSFYMSSASNGLGLAHSFTWQLARNNFHGVNGGGTANIQNPFFCDNTSVQSTYPCNMPDDESWSRAVLTQEAQSVVRLTQAGQGGGQTSTPVNGTTSYSYLVTYPLLAQECADCQASFYWGSQNDNDYLDYYNNKFMGFAQTTVTHPDGAVDVHKYHSTEGIGVYDTTQLPCNEYPPNPCHNDPWWDLANAAHGHEFELDRYDQNGTTLLEQVKTTWHAVCPPSGVSGSPPVTGDGNWGGNLVSALDHSNPVAVCDVQRAQVDTYTYDGSSSTSVPHQTVAYAYDSYGRVTSQATTSNDGSANGSPTTIVSKASYTFDDNVSATGTSATGTYLIDFPGFSDVEDSSANRYRCAYTSYDGQANTLGQTGGLTLGEVTRVDRYTGCGSSGNGFTPSGPITTTHTYDASGNQLTTNDPDANAGNAAHKGCTVSGATYSACTTYDGTFGALATAVANVLNQTSQTGYQAPASGTATGGFGLWPISKTDANGQTTALAWDPLGRQVSATLPGEGTGLTTVGTAYTVWCSGTGAQSPCVEVDHAQRLNSTTTVTYRAFYDGLGHLVETRSPAPNNQDVVSYSYYDPSQRPVYRSAPYFVTAYTGAPGAAAYSIPDSTQAGTSYTYDGLGRQTSNTDALSNRANTSYTVACNVPSTGDSACYEQTLSADPLGHQGGALTDALRRTDYVQRYTGNSPSTYAVYATAKYTYDFVNDLTKVVQPNGTTAVTYQYDMAGRLTGVTDPDLGTQVYAYDQDGNLTESADARGASGTFFVGYDGIDRPIWRNTTNSPTGAYDTYGYDSTANGNVGIGRLTGETFAEAPSNSLSGSYTYVYDSRGRQTATTLTVGSTSYPQQATYDDAGDVLTQAYPDSELITNSYTTQGWLAGVTTTQGSTTTTLLGSATYGGSGGAAGMITGAALGNGTYQYSATYDLLARATDLKVTRSSDGTSLFEQARTFDGAGDVSTASTTLPGGTDNQAFCYDEQDRLTWAGSVGTPPCTGTAINAGTLTAAQYSQAFAYDSMGRLANGPLGSYTYGDSAHVHAATVIGTGYTASYDAAGEMTCRAPTTSSTCTGSTPTGAQLGYDDEGRVLTWQDRPTSPTATAAFLYDGQGQRVVQQAAQGGSTTTTVYVGGFEQVATTGSTTTTTAFYYAGGQRIGLSVNGTISYLASDALGSSAVALNGSGTATASMLYAPYGTVRYSSGTMPTDYGFTGQHSDGLSGLGYYGARYYDPVAGQFVTADSILPGGGFDLWGLSRYAYVEGNPVGRTDPTGHEELDPGGGGGCDPSFCGGGSPDPGLSCGDFSCGALDFSAPPPPPDPIIGLTCGCAGSSPPPPADPVVGITCGCAPAAPPPPAPDNPPPPDTKPPTVTDFIPHMMGLGYSAQAEAGRGPQAAGGAASLDYLTPLPWEGPSYDVLGFSDGGFARNDSALQAGPLSIPPFSAGYPGQDRGQVFGLYGGAGPHAILSNARTPNDLAGSFTQYSVNFGYVETLGVQLSIGTNAKGQPIYVASLAPRFLPAGAGIGIAGSRYAINTTVLWSPLSGGLIEDAS